MIRIDAISLLSINDQNCSEMGDKSECIFPYRTLKQITQLWYRFPTIAFFKGILFFDKWIIVYLFCVECQHL